MNPTAIKAAMKKLADDAQEIVATKSLSTPAKRSELKRIEAEMKAYSDEINVQHQASMLGGAGGSIFGGDGVTTFGTKSYGGPSLTLADPQLKALHQAATSKQALKVEIDTKSAVDLTPDFPATLAPGIVAFRREPTRVASLFPNQGMPGPSLEYIRQTGVTGAAGTVSPGGAKPEIVPTIDTITAFARKIAGHIGVNDESLLDFAATNQYLTGELTRALFSAENTQLLSGNGTAPNIEGILNVTGVLTRTQAASPETPIDTLEMALTDLRTGSSFTDATGYVMNPADWSAIRLLKNTYGDYILGHPAEGDGAMLWGKPVVVTTDCPAKTVLVGNFDIGGALLIRQGITIETQSTGVDWTSNVTRFRAEERVGLAVYRPSAFVKVTLL